MKRKALSVILLLSLLIMATASVVSAQDPSPIVPLSNPMAAFLESRAYAIEQGATGEFRKMEWVAANYKTKKLYLAMSEINKSMSDGEGDIQLTENECGIIYEATLDADYNINKLVPEIVGGPYNNKDNANRCAVDNIANPDALFVDVNGFLWIGEDSSNHQNNYLWRWDGSKLKRFLSFPDGAEVTGVFVNDNGVMFVSLQHPSAMSIYPYNRASVLVINGWTTDQDFESIDVPEGDDMFNVVVAAGTVQVLARVGEEIPNSNSQHFGQVNRPDGSQVLNINRHYGLGTKYCAEPDGNTFIPTKSDGSEGYLFTNWECDPGGVTKMYIRQYNSRWTVYEGENIDFAPVNGTWNNCGTSLTPWNTVLTSEEYEPSTDRASYKLGGDISNLTDYMGKQANPYDYGWLIELSVDESGHQIQTHVEKRFALGRFSHEMGLVMPDAKTMYHGDDGSGVVFFKTVADEEGDLSAGTIYAAKITQSGDELGIEWIKLGQSNDDEIYEALEKINLP